MYDSRNKCVRLEQHFVGIHSVDGVAEWTERRRDLAEILVRLRAQLGPFCQKTSFEHFCEVDRVLYKVCTLLYCIIL